MSEIEKRNPFKGYQPQSAQEHSKMVGGYLPNPLANHLRLLSVYHGRSFQSILQQIILEWCKTQETEEEIIDALAAQAFYEWQRRASEYKGKTTNAKAKEAEKYEEELKGILERRKVAEHHIQAVLNKFRSKKSRVA